MHLNYNKTKSMSIYRTKSPPIVTPLIFDNITISEVESIKILGILFSNNTKWNEQFSAVKAKAYRALSLIRKPYNEGCDQNTIYTSYASHVFSNIAYGWPAICDLTKSQMNEIKTIDKTAHKWCDLIHYDFSIVRLDKIC